MLANARINQITDATSINMCITLEAVAKSNDPDATRQRIEDFQTKNRIKGTAIMLVGSAALLAYTSSNPYVPPGI